MRLSGRDVPGPEAGVWPHGSRQRYQGNRRTKGCRCDECKQANNEYMKERRALTAKPKHDKLYDNDPFLGSLLP